VSATADLEIAALRRAEARDSAKMAEFERLLRSVWPHYACDFMLGEVPDGTWVDPHVQLLHWGMPPRDRKGWVVVSLNTLRDLARRISA
jgi:hypothetical protein